MRSLTRSDLREAQKIAIPFIKDTLKCALFAEMGIGKTGATITAIVDLLESFDTGRALIIAPLRVARKTWPDEFKTWTHARWVKYKCLWGAKHGVECTNQNGEKRIRFWERKLEKLREELFELQTWGDGSPKNQAEMRKLKRNIQIGKRALEWGYISARDQSDVHMINRENVPFLVHFWGKYWPYDTVVFDESSGLRNGKKALRWRAMRAVMPYTRRFIELTGTPAPNGLLGLWGQVFLLDGGKRLGTSMEAFKTRFFYPTDYNQYNWEPKPGAEEAIYDLISDVCMTLRAADFMDLPETVFNNVPVLLSDSEMKLYQKFKKELILQLPDGEVTAANAAVLAGKLLQLSNGVVYGEDKKVHEIHEAKLDAAEDYVEEQQGAPVLIMYWFKPDLERLRKRFPKFRVFAEEGDELTDEWNTGSVPGMFLHPQSAGHGLNIQFGGRRILWYGPIHDLELYQQANARLAGARATGTTFIHHLVAQGTADEAILESLEQKDGTQNRLLNALKRVIHG